MNAKEAAEAVVSKLQQQLQVAALASAAASAAASTAKLEHQNFGDSDNGHQRFAAVSAVQHDADSALAGLWGGSGIVAPARAWDSGSADGDRQLRAMRNSVQALQMELIDVRQQAQRSAENEGRLRAQLQRILAENDTALVMLGQVGAQRPAVGC